MAHLILIIITTFRNWATILIIKKFYKNRNEKFNETFKKNVKFILKFKRIIIIL